MPSARIPSGALTAWGFIRTTSSSATWFCPGRELRTRDCEGKLAPARWALAPLTVGALRSPPVLPRDEETSPLESAIDPTMLDGATTIAVAVSVTLPGVVPAVVAETLCAPPAAPSVQPVVAMPFAAVTLEVAESVPPPVATAQVTGTLAMSWDVAVRTRTPIGAARAPPLGADCPSPDAIARVTPAPSEAVALPVAAIPPAVAVTVCPVPSTRPSVQLALARPCASVVACALVTPPLPAVTAQVTAAPATTLLNASRNSATTGWARAEPTAALWALPDTTVPLAIAAAVTVALKVAGVLTPRALAVAVFAPPTPVPTVQVVEAWPCALVLTVVA